VTLSGEVLRVSVDNCGEFHFSPNGQTFYTCKVVDTNSPPAERVHFLNEVFRVRLDVPGLGMQGVVAARDSLHDPLDPAAPTGCTFDGRSFALADDPSGPVHLVPLPDWRRVTRLFETSTGELLCIDALTYEGRGYSQRVHIGEWMRPMRRLAILSEDHYKDGGTVRYTTSEGVLLVPTKMGTPAPPTWCDRVVVEYPATSCSFGSPGGPDWLTVMRQGEAPSRPDCWDRTPPPRTPSPTAGAIE
jgi:hypothetical protein